MKTITVELSPASCKQAVKELQEYARKIEPKMDEVCRRAAEIGALVANSRLVLSGGNTDVNITVEKMGNGYKLVMSGADVYFVEFGTGSDVSPHYPVSVPVFAGSWSMEHSQQYAKRGWWWYGGQVYTGTPAFMPMYYAGKTIREELPKIAKEVFGR